MTECKWMQDEICVNADCPVCCDYCPVADYEGVCRYEDRGAAMTEYMKREDVIKAAKHARAKGLEPSQYIETIPTAEVVPVKHGKWIEKPFLLGTSRFCSSCGSNYGMPHEVFNYCPNCGAKMDKEE